MTEEVKVLSKVFYKNVISYSVDELSKLAGLGPCSESQIKPKDNREGPKDHTAEDDKDMTTDKPEMVTDKIKLIKFKMGSMASRLTV